MTTPTTNTPTDDVDRGPMVPTVDDLPGVSMFGYLPDGYEWTYHHNASGQLCRTLKRVGR